MNDLLSRLQALTGALEVTEGLLPEVLADVRCRVAASLIHEDASRSPAIAHPAYSDALKLAAAAGDPLAAERTAAGRSRRAQAPRASGPLSASCPSHRTDGLADESHGWVGPAGAVSACDGGMDTDP